MSNKITNPLSFGTSIDDGYDDDYDDGYGRWIMIWKQYIIKHWFSVVQCGNWED